MERLIAMREDPQETSFDVRMHAAGTLVDLAVPQDPGIFIEALRGKSLNLAIAATALGKLAYREAVELLIQRLQTMHGGRAACTA